MAKLQTREDYWDNWTARRLAELSMLEGAELNMKIEEEWLNAEAPQWMYSQIADGTESHQYVHGVTREREQYFVDACNRLCDCNGEYGEDIKKAARWVSVNDREGCKCTRKRRAHLLRDIFGNPFRPVVREKEYLTDPAVKMRVYDHAHRNAGIEYSKDDKIKVKKGTIFDAKGTPKAVLLEDVKYTREDWVRYYTQQLLEESVFREKWITPTASSILQRVIEGNEGKGDYGLLPYLADALEDEGCTNIQVLEHLRASKDCEACNGTRKEFRMKSAKAYSSPIGWIDKTSGLLPIPMIEVDCPACKGTGRVYELHVKGCWVVELLKGQH